MKKRYLTNILLMGIILVLLCTVIYFLCFNKQKDIQADVSQMNSSDAFEQTEPEITPEISVPENSSDIPSTPVKEPVTTKEDSVLSEERIPLSHDDLHQLPSGTIIDITNAGDKIMKNGFYYEEITDNIMSRIKGKSYGKDCTVPLKDLRYVRVLYYGFDKETHIGELIVNTAIADDIIDIFMELYEAKYPIEQMVLIDEYDADDNVSMAADNTSSFNYRLVPGSNHLSKHALGLAIDINPLYNPYVQYNEDGTVILPEEGIPYADRTLDCPYYINEEDLCYQAFTRRGFTWGGSWDSEPDYQHFQKVSKALQRTLPRQFAQTQT